MKYLIFFVFICFSFFNLQSEVTLKANVTEIKDLSCITLLILAGEKSKEDGEMVKYEKLNKLKKNYLSKYDNNHFSKNQTQSMIDAHKMKIKEKGKRYINKNLQKCGLK